MSLPPPVTTPKMPPSKGTPASPCPGLALALALVLLPSPPPSSPSLLPFTASLHSPAPTDSPPCRNRKARVRLGRRAAAPQDVQVLERRQVLHLALHPQALRTAPVTHAHAHAYALARAHIHTGPRADCDIVEWLRRAAAPLDRPQPRHPPRLLLHSWQCHPARAIRPGSRRTRALMGLLQLCLWHVDVLDHGQRRRKASASHRDVQPPRRALRVRGPHPSAALCDTTNMIAATASTPSIAPSRVCLRQPPSGMDLPRLAHSPP